MYSTLTFLLQLIRDRKIVPRWGVGQAIKPYVSHAVTVFSLIACPALSSPGIALAKPPDTAVLQWAIVGTPGNRAEKGDIRCPCEVNAIAIGSDGKTVYAIDVPNASSAPVSNPGIWKSSDGGNTWSRKPTQHLVQAIPSPILPVMDIALAPDDPNLLAAVCLDNLGTLRREIYLSDDGGASWAYTGAVPWIYGGNEQIGDIAISPGYNFGGKLVHDIIIGSRHPGGGVGEIYIYSYPSFNGWKAQGFTLGDVISVCPSPNYTADFTLVVMAATALRTYISLGYRDIGANACRWNKVRGWPVELCELSQSGGNTSGEDKIITGVIALTSDFIGTSEKRRLIFAAYDSNGTAFGTSQVLDDVYRLEDTRVFRLRLPGAGTSARISTVAYAGNKDSGKLVAGEVAANLAEATARVWICHDPLSSCPVWRLSLKQPTGGGRDGYANAQLGWSPDSLTAFCGTGSGNRDTPQKWADPADPAWGSQSLDESAISITADDGESWNQIGLIDTRLDRIRSVVVAEDESTLYLASVNGMGFDSLWRSQSSILGESWQRILCFSGDSPILILSPESKDGADIFWANQGTDRACSSTDAGQTWHDCLPNVPIQHMAASDSRTLYILQGNGEVRKGGYTDGWKWTKSVDTCLSTGHTIAVYKDVLLVGAAANEPSPVAYSSDGGQTWVRITEQTPSAGNRHVAFDIYFATNQIIYVADDAGGIYRWNLGKSHSWDDLSPPNHSFYGIASSGRGVVYGAYCSAESGTDRALYPRSGIPKPGIYWDSLATGLASGVEFTIEPSAITASVSSLWAVDARDYSPAIGQGCLWAFTDTLARTGPKLIEPNIGAVVGYDPVSGKNQEVALRWQQLSLADGYEIEIARDAAFSLRVTEAEPAANPFYQPAVLTSPAYRIPPGVLPEADTTYYWRVRVRQAATSQMIRSHWSEKGSFSVKAGFRVVSPYLGAQALEPVHGARDIPVSAVAFSWTPFQGAKEYEFVLARDSALREKLAQETVMTSAYIYRGRLDYATTYFWQVAATKPVPSEASPVFSFTTVAQPLPPMPSEPYYQLLHWLQASVLVNVFGFITLVAMVILFFRSRRI